MKHINEFGSPYYDDPPSESFSTDTRRKDSLFDVIFGYFREPGIEPIYPKDTNGLNIMRKLDDNSIWLLSMGPQIGHHSLMETLFAINKKYGKEYFSEISHSADDDDHAIAEWDINNLATDMYKDKAYVHTVEEWEQSEEEGGKPPYPEMTLMKLDDPGFIEETIQRIKEWENRNAHNSRAGRSYLERTNPQERYNPWTSIRRKSRDKVQSSHWFSRKAILALNRWLKEVKAKKNS
jgi:hypothetical protein